jgi:hypothetical protein
VSGLSFGTDWGATKMIPVVSNMNIFFIMLAGFAL